MRVSFARPQYTILTIRMGRADDTERYGFDTKKNRGTLPFRPRKREFFGFARSVGALMSPVLMGSQNRALRHIERGPLWRKEIPCPPLPRPEIRPSFLDLRGCPGSRPQAEVAAESSWRLEPRPCRTSWWDHDHS